VVVSIALAPDICRVCGIGYAGLVALIETFLAHLINRCKTTSKLLDFKSFKGYKSGHSVVKTYFFVLGLAYVREKES